MGAEHGGAVIRGKEGTVPALEEAVVLKGQEGLPLATMPWGYTCRMGGRTRLAARGGWAGAGS